MLTKSFKKLAKIVMFLSEYIKLNILEQQITECSSDNNTILQISYLESLFTISLYDKYQYSQILISKGFNIVKQLL